MTLDYDAVVIGSGHNGLVAAAYLGKAGKRVLVIEKAADLGGATQSAAPFPGVDARLSRYSYLVALFPDQIKRDLGLEFETLSRKVSSFTPWSESGILINREFDDESNASLTNFANDPLAGEAWRSFYSRLATFASKIAPTLLEPLRDDEEMREIVGGDLWEEFVSQPLEITLKKNFTNDVIRGIVLTDGLIGTFASAREKAANICFIYHLIGNGIGEWRVPRGGMGALVAELIAKCQRFGVEFMASNEVVKVEDLGEFVLVHTADGNKYKAAIALANCAPQVLERLSGIKSADHLDGSQLKLNLVLDRLPKLKCGVDPASAFAGTFHVNESFSQLERAFEEASSGVLPSTIPCEMYCHTLTDPTILSTSLRESGAHTLTLFAIHTPASLFDSNHDEVKAEAFRRIIAGLNSYLAEPIESCIAKDANGELCIEFKTPQDLEREIGLPRGNIFHGDLQFPWRTEVQQGRWGVETSKPRILLAGSGAVRGGGVSGIPGHNAAKAALERI